MISKFQIYYSKKVLKAKDMYDFLQGTSTNDRFHCGGRLNLFVFFSFPSILRSVF